MSGEVNRVPVGLLSILDMKARGQNPRVLDGTLGASIELLDLYLQQNRQSLQAGTNFVNARGFFGAFTVPQGSIYWVHNISASIAAPLAAGTTYKFRLGYQIDALARFMAIGPAETYTAGEQFLYLATRPPTILPAGAIVGVWCENVTLGTAVQVLAWADITPLTV